MKLAIADNRISYGCERSLLKLGFRVIKLSGTRSLSAPLASHPDMLIFAHGRDIITSCEYAECADCELSDISAAVDGLRLSFTADIHSDKYPQDCIFNALAIGNMLFAKTDTCSRAVINYAAEQGMELVHTKQGYPACTVLPLGDSHAITADHGMAKLMSKNGIEVTLIRNGDIALPPYEHGFIGGAAGVLGDTVYFLGNPEYHRDFERIAEAISCAGMRYTALADEPLSDLGRLILYN